MHVYILSHYLSISWSRTHFFLGKPEMSMDSSTSIRNNTYWLNLQANCATIWWGKTQIGPLLTSSEYFIFLRESLAKAFTNQSVPLTKARFQTKNKQPRCIKVGNWLLRIRLWDYKDDEIVRIITQRMLRLSLVFVHYLSEWRMGEKMGETWNFNKEGGHLG